MAYSDMIAAIDTKVDEELGTDPGGAGYAVQHDNEEMFDKPDDAVWLRSSVRNGESTNVARGDGVEYRIPGNLIIQVFGPLGTDVADVNDAVDEVMSRFGHLRLSVGDSEGTVVRFQAPAPQPLGRVQGQYQVNVTVPFWADFISNT